MFLLHSLKVVQIFHVLARLIHSFQTSGRWTRKSPQSIPGIFAAYGRLVVKLSLFSSLFNEARRSDPQLDFYSKESEFWASGADNYRSRLREDLKTELQARFPQESLNSILDLEKIPQIENGFISISHCPIVGAYVLCNRPLGIDIELSDRVSPEIVKRICRKSEIELTGNWAGLWTAKESLYKAHGTLKVIADSHIERWSSAEGGLICFGDGKHEGWITQNNGLTVALCLKV